MTAQHIACLDFGEAGSERWRALVRLSSCRRCRPPPAELHPLLPFPAADLKVEKLKLGTAVPPGVPRGWLLLNQPRHPPPPAVPPPHTPSPTACRFALLWQGMHLCSTAPCTSPAHFPAATTSR